MLLKIKKLRESVKVPHQTHDSDAGYDLFFCPADSKPVFIDSGESMLLSTGLSFEFDKDYVVEIKNRSSVASKKKLIVGACVVDSGYRGEVFVNLINVGHASQMINPDDKIAQFVIYKVEKAEFVLQDELNDSSRGVGGFGSTGK
jgi:dUTP pyrophosphatase